MSNTSGVWVYGAAFKYAHVCMAPRCGKNHPDEFDRVKYQSVKDTTSLITEGCYFAKVDLKYTFRSIPLHPSQYKYTVFKRKFKGDNDFTYLYDRCLCFGARLAPGILHRISQSIRQMMARRWFKGIAYLDDFLIVEKKQRTVCSSLKNANIFVTESRTGNSVGKSWRTNHHSHVFGYRA